VAIKAFLDANVFFAGARSSQGGSGFILELAKKHQIEVITIKHALLEAERNIQKKLGGKYLIRHYQNLLDIKPKIQIIGFVAEEDDAKHVMIK